MPSSMRAGRSPCSQSLFSKHQQGQPLKRGMKEQEKSSGWKETPSAQNNVKDKPHVPGEGLRSLRTTGVFRAVNFELYVKPNKVIMAFGVVAMTCCLSYIGYMKYKYEQMGYYTAVTEDGEQILRQRKSRWDS